jgi:hypothetical protein
MRSAAQRAIAASGGRGDEGSPADANHGSARSASTAAAAAAWPSPVA